MAKEIPIEFKHPRDSKVEKTDCDPAVTTGSGAVKWLVDEGFMPALTDKTRGYQLSIDRTSKAILPNQTFADAGVKEGDSISVTETGAGA
jgi:hypothetical protein